MFPVSCPNCHEQQNDKTNDNSKIYRVTGVAEYLEHRSARNKFQFGSDYYERIAFNKSMSRSVIIQILDFNKRARINSQV